MAPHDERIAAFGKRLPEELEDGRDRSLRNQCGRQVGDRAADESLVVIGRRTRIEFDFGRMVVAAAGSLQRLAGTRGIGWQWWQQTCDDIVTHLHESDTYAGPPHAVR